MTDKITYKYLTTEDEVQQVYKLMAIPSIYKFTGPPLFPPSIRDSARKRHIIVAKDGDRVAGFINFNKNKEGYSVIHYSVTSPDYQRRGIALALTRHVPPPWFAKCKLDNEPIQALHKKLGMVCVGVETRHTKKGTEYKVLHYKSK